MVAILLGADNGFFYAGQIMHFSSPFTVFLIYHKHPYRVEAIARTILPDIQAYYQTEEGNAAFKKWQAEQAALGTSKPIAKSQKRGRKKS